MTVMTTLGSLNNTNDASFRNWVARAIDMLEGVGLVRTSDGGQIDPATVVRPIAASVIAGYAIFRLPSDYAQEERPVFLRVEFGSGTSASYPGLRVVVCKGTDGDGGAIDVLHSSLWCGIGTATTASEWRAVGLPGCVALCPATRANSAGLPFFLVERSPDGMSIMVVEQQMNNHTLNNTGSALVPRCTVVSYDGGGVTSGIVPVVLPHTIAGAVLAGGTPLASASLGPVFPWVLFPPGEAPWQSRLGISYPGGDAPGVDFQVTLEGEDRTYLPIPLNESYHGFGLGISHTGSFSRHVGLAIRWE